MKKLSILLVSTIALPTYGQSLMSALNKYQSSLKNPSSTSPTSNPSDVKPSGQSQESSVKKCLMDEDQTSLPLNYVTSLIMQTDAALDIRHDQRAGTLSISSEDMIGNCSSMLSWSLNKPTIGDRPAYAVEVKIAKGTNCNEQGCEYKVAKVTNGEFDKFETIRVKPTMKGFEACLNASGVFKNGEVDAKAIYPNPVKEKFTKVDASGPIYLQSHGPSSSIIKAKYGKFEYQDGCDYYETIHPTVKELLTYEDSERSRLRAEADKLKECKPDEYNKLVEFIENHRDFADELVAKLSGDLQEAAKKAAENIEKGKYTDEDLKVISDFNNYVVKPKVEAASAIYNQMVELQGEAKKAKQDELKKAVAELSALRQKPYFQSSHTLKLLNDGKFEEAKTLNSAHLTLDNYKQLGQTIAGVQITPTVAKQKVMAGTALFETTVTEKEEEYKYKTGQMPTGKAKAYSRLASQYRKNIETRTANYNQAMQEEMMKLQPPSGHCTKYWVNKQKCYAEVQANIEEFQKLLAFYNGVDQRNAEKNDELAKKYGDLESEGARYIANQNGEPAPTEEEEKKEEVDTTAPPRRTTSDQSVYNFDYQAQQQGQAANPQMYQNYGQNQGQYMPQNYQNPMYPYQNGNMFQQQSQFGYQPSFLGQQSYPGFGTQNGYSFNWGGTGYNQLPQWGAQTGYNTMQPTYWGQQSPNMFAQQQPMYPQQQGYWGNPMQSQQYQYSMWR